MSAATFSAASTSRDGTAWMSASRLTEAMQFASPPIPAELGVTSGHEVRAIAEGRAGVATSA